MKPTIVSRIKASLDMFFLHAHCQVYFVRVYDKFHIRSLMTRILLIFADIRLPLIRDYLLNLRYLCSIFEYEMEICRTHFCNNVVQTFYFIVIFE